jgi:hypothetical protein
VKRLKGPECCSAETAETTAAGCAGREGTYYGRPFGNRLEAVGLTADLALDVGFDDSSSQWFDPSLVQRLGFDSAPAVT